MGHLLMTMKVPAGCAQNQIARVTPVENAEFDVTTITEKISDQFVIGLGHVGLSDELDFGMIGVTRNR
jgi:hypothetical protein